MSAAGWSLWLPAVLAVAVLMLVVLAMVGAASPADDSQLVASSSADRRNQHTEQLASYTARVANGFETNHLYVYCDGRLQTDIVERLVQHPLVAPVTIHKYDASQPIAAVDDNYVRTFHLNVLPDIDQEDINLSYVNAIAGDKYNSHFMLLVEAPVSLPASDTWALQAFRQFWRKDLFNVLIVCWQPGSGLRVLTYNPFRLHGLVELDATAATAYGQLFWDKAADLNGTPLRVSLFKEKTRAKIGADGKLSAGTDALLTELVARHMNASLQILPPADGFDIGEFLATGGATGSLAQVLSGEVDVSFNTRFLRLKQFAGKIQITFTNGRDDICFMVPTAGYASNIYNIFRAFSSPVWFMTLGSLLAVPASFALLYRLQRETQPLQNVFLNFYSWHLAQPIMRLPENWATKVLIAFWILYCLLITSSYQGNLTSNLVLRPTLPEINTIKQLDASQLEILTFGRYVQLLLQFMNSTTEYSRLPHVIRSVSTAQELELLVNAHDRRYAYANKQHINAYLSRRKGNIVNNRRLFHNVVECPVPFLVAYALRIGSPYLARINVLLRRAQENGLIALWDGQAEETMSGRQRGAGDGPVPLTLDHMQSPFYILCLGLVLALAGMTLEMCWDWRAGVRRERRERRRQRHRPRRAIFVVMDGK